MADKFELQTEPASPQPPLPLPPGGTSNTRPPRRKKDSARLVWDSKPKRPPSPRDIEFQTAEIVIPNPARDSDSLPFTTGGGLLDGREIDHSTRRMLRGV